jgi:2-polyprenyl-3-methyl-5-hydroxy-6-metoxy-1,4-benzoquinol methylase
MAENNFCNLCQGSKFKIIYKKFGLYLVKCKECGLVYSFPKLPEQEIFKRYSEDYLFDEYLTIFQAGRQSYDLELIRNHYSLYLQLLDPFSGEGKKVLDVGCGPGFFLKAVEERNWRAEGVEVSEAAVKYAKDVVKVQVHHGKLEDIVFSPGSFDAVVLLDALEHLSNPLQTLRHCHDLLKEKGILILNTPDYNSLSRLILRKDWAVLSPAEHLYNFTQRTLSRLLKDAEFRSMKIFNLIQFNPDYTHNKNSYRYKVWKRMNHFLDKSVFFQRIKTKNYQRVLGALEEGIQVSRYNFIGRFFRGDVLIAIARKV